MTDSASAVDARFIELETRYMHLSDLLEKLNGALVDQRREIDALTMQVKRLREQLDTGDDLDASDQPPPHYGGGGSLFAPGGGG